MEEISISIYQYNINPHEPEMNFAGDPGTSAEKAAQAGSSLTGPS